MSLPKLLKDIADKYLDGRADAFWQHKQSSQWLIKHRDLEIAAGKAGIRFDPPTFVESDSTKCVAMVVTGRFGNLVEWSVGEASPKNTQQSYPYAMAEKRAKDRVILKLFGVHGHAYSEEEADDFKQTKEVGNKAKPATSSPIDKARAWLNTFATAVDAMADANDTADYIRANVKGIRAASKYPALESTCADYLAVIGEGV